MIFIEKTKNILLTISSVKIYLWSLSDELSLWSKCLPFEQYQVKRHTCQWTASDDAEIKAAHACHDASLWQRVWSPRRNRLSANHQAGETQPTIRNYDLLKNTEFTNTFVVPLYFNYLTTQPSFTVVKECPIFFCVNCFSEFSRFNHYLHADRFIIAQLLSTSS